jgi:phosphatidylglycerophosphate synthase
MPNWLSLKLTGVGAMICGLVWVLTTYSVRVSNPLLAQLAGVAGVCLAILAVADALDGGLTD